MKKKDAEKIGKQLLPNMPGFQAKGNLVFSRPISHVLQALYFEGSSYSKEDFYLNIFIFPLFSPEEHLSFNYGERLQHSMGQGWNTDMPNLISQLEEAVNSEQAALYLTPINSISEFIQRLDVINSGSDKSLYYYEAMGFAHVLNGETDEAFKNLRKVEEQANVSSHWQLKLKERSEYFQKLLKENPIQAIKQLEEWEAFTVENLKV